MRTPVKILIVDDHMVVSQSLSERLERESRFTVVGYANNAEEGLEKIRRRRPDVVLMDIEMPGMASFEAAETVSLVYPNTKVIFLSGFANDHYIEQALKAHAIGYLTKQAPIETIIKAIDHAAVGEAYYSKDIQYRIVFEKNSVKLAKEPTTRGSTLTNRETQVLRYIAQGMSAKQIAHTMYISVKTVANHTAKLMDKLDIHDRVELTRYAIREGFVGV